MQYINLHTHIEKSGSDIQILNVFAQDLNDTEPDHFFSAGIHPWHIENVNPEECFRFIEKSMQNSNMLAIGECGLDRAIDTDFALQKELFQKQIALALKYNKPLIIHCVRAYSDLIGMKKDLRSDIPWILHGFQGNRDTTADLIRHGFYFSIGKALFDSTKLQQVLPEIPIERLFFETDDSEFSIQKIYLFAAQILKTDEELLMKAIAINFKKLFGDDKLVGKD